MYRSTLLLLAAITSLAVAQLGVPACATSCIVLPTECVNGDPRCICNNQQWIANISCCVFRSCDQQGQTQALQYAQQICTPVGATLPTAASCSNTTSTNSTSSTSSSRAAASSTSASTSAASASTSRAAGVKIGVEGVAGLFMVGAALL